MLGQWTGAEQKAFQSVLDAFDAKTGAQATYTPAAGGDMATVLGAKVNGGTPPDVAILSLPGAISQYATAGKLQPASSGAESAVKQNFADEWATLATVNGKLYGVPVDASNKSTVWYDANAFKNAGISGTPASWDEWMKDASTLSDSGVSVPVSVSFQLTVTCPPDVGVALTASWATCRSRVVSKLVWATSFCTAAAWPEALYS